MVHPDQSLERIGTTIAGLLKSLADQLKALNQPEPSFAADAPTSFPQDPELQRIRLELLDSLASIQHLVTGASDFWLNGSVFVSCFSLEIKSLQLDTTSKAHLLTQASQTTSFLLLMCSTVSNSGTPFLSMVQPAMPRLPSRPTCLSRSSGAF